MTQNHSDSGQNISNNVTGGSKSIMQVFRRILVQKMPNNDVEHPKPTQNNFKYNQEKMYFWPKSV